MGAGSVDDPAPEDDDPQAEVSAEGLTDVLREHLLRGTLEGPLLLPASVDCTCSPVMFVVLNPIAAAEGICSVAGCLGLRPRFAGGHWVSAARNGNPSCMDAGLLIPHPKDLSCSPKHMVQKQEPSSLFG